MGLTVLTVWHLYLVSTGQTTIEFYQNQGNRTRFRTFTHAYDFGVKENFRELLGLQGLESVPWWALGFVTSVRKPVGDGFSYTPNFDLD